jgi:hypothetical protein
MKIFFVSKFGRQVFRSAILIASVSLVAMAVGCGGPKEAVIDATAAEEDPMDVGAGAEDELGSEAEAAPSEEPASEEGK